MSGFLKFYKAGIIKDLPKIIGVQSEHADPVFRYYEQQEEKRRFVPVKVRPSVAQAAMIGDPVSMPRVIELVKEYDSLAGRRRFYVVQVKEQEIMDCMITANRNGNIVCTQGGESLAGLVRAKEKGYVSDSDTVILNSTAHMLKFISFQQMYFEDSFPPEFEVRPKEELKNQPLKISPKTGKDRYSEFIKEVAEKIAHILNLKEK
jgi:threonine synthase